MITKHCVVDSFESEKILLKTLAKIGESSSTKCLWKSDVRLSQPGDFLGCNCFIAVSISFSEISKVSSSESSSAKCL